VPTALLHHIGLEAAPAPDAAGLRAVHRAYLERVPYEDLAVQLGESGPLDAAALTERVLSGRGGYCFELNTVLAALLRELGFSVSYHEGVVGGEGPTNHMVLVVDLGGERWLADAGLGEGFVDPVPLREGRHHGPGPFTWTLAREPEGTWWLGQHEWGSVSGFRLQAAPCTLAAFAPHHRRLSTDLGSRFVQTLVLQRPMDDRIVTLRSRTLSEKGPEVDAKRVVADRDDFAAVLREEFGVALDAQRLERAWARAAAQHEAFQAKALGREGSTSSVTPA
jgi:N-hydroxyarylamine O-acetyltransferase